MRQPLWILAAVLVTTSIWGFITRPSEEAKSAPTHQINGASLGTPVDGFARSHESNLAPAVDPNQGRRIGETTPYILYGRAVDIEGHPLEGVVVTLTEWPNTYMGKFTTGKNGEFRFPDQLVYDSQYAVAASKAGYRRESLSMKRHAKALIFYLQAEQSQKQPAR